MKPAAPLRLPALLAAAGLVALPAPAETPPPVTLNFLGVPGIIDMPSGESMPDGELGVTISSFGGITRNTLTFQLTPRISGSFRYSATQDWPNEGFDVYYDRSFDLRFQVLEEGPVVPGVVVGLQDFIGTGLNSAEYVVATKTFGDRLRVSGGVGWGRLGNRDGFGNIFGLDDRPDDFEPTGGTVNDNRWFRGDMALFGGLEYDIGERVTLLAEYSSDEYLEEASRDIIDQASPFNFGIQYRPRPGINLGAFYMYGSEFGVQAAFNFNPQRLAYGVEEAPLPVNVTPRDLAAAQSWGPVDPVSPATQDRLRDSTAALFDQQGLELESLRIDGETATVFFRNNRYDIEAQALGRAARSLTYAMPESVRRFTLVPTRRGLPLARVTVDRADLVNAEHAQDGGEGFFDFVEVADAAGPGPRGSMVDGTYPRLTYGLAPYVTSVIFGLENPVQAELGLELQSRFDVAPGLSVNGAVQLPLIGNVDDLEVSESALEPVRTELPLYNESDGLRIDRLTADYLFRPGEDLYGRLTVGYLERMYGGVSAEVLWKPVDSRLALGAEVNYVRKREYDQGFGFLDFDTVTGHASAYYDFRNGFEGQIDLGRYLAGDYGGTFTLTRAFNNGWRVGAFATLTDVSFEDFGDGSFDKGILLEIPLSTVTGQPSQQTSELLIRPFLRDGGARVDVEDRLYETVRDYHRPVLEETSGRFWR